MDAEVAEIAASPGSGEGETATGVMDPRTREKGSRGLRLINMVITLIRGWIWRDLTMFLQDFQSGWVYHQMQKSYKGVKLSIGCECITVCRRAV